MRQSANIVKRDPIQNPKYSNIKDFAATFNSNTTWKDSLKATVSFAESEEFDSRFRRGSTLKLETVNSDDDKIKFPKFVPDDPDNPHLTSTKREKARRAVIAAFI